MEKGYCFVSEDLAGFSEEGHDDHGALITVHRANQKKQKALLPPQEAIKTHHKRHLTSSPAETPLERLRQTWSMKGNFERERGKKNDWPRCFQTVSLSVVD